MRENRIRKVMSEGKLALGTYINFADPQVVEIIGLAGYDAAFIDMEHSTFDLNLITEMIRACDLAGITSIVRVPGNDEKLILRLLDAGAEGIIIPHVAGLEGAKKAVEAVRYGPLGHRGGAGGTRAAAYGTVAWEELRGQCSPLTSQCFPGPFLCLTFLVARHASSPSYRVTVIPHDIQELDRSYLTGISPK